MAIAPPPVSANPENPDEVRRFIDTTKLYLQAIRGLVQDIDPGQTLGSMALQDKDAVDIDGGTIDGTTIGGATPAAGTFTDVVAATVKATSQWGLGVLASQQAHVADGPTDAETNLSVTMPADAPADADALRDDLVANALAELKAGQDALAAKINAVGAAVNALIDVVEAFGLAAGA